MKRATTVTRSYVTQPCLAAWILKLVNLISIHKIVGSYNILSEIVIPIKLVHSSASYIEEYKCQLNHTFILNCQIAIMRLSS